MREWVRQWLGWLLALIAVIAITAVFVFDRDQSKADRAHSIASRLRCPVCQGESIADSPASMAREMRTLVDEQVEAGKTDAEIEAFFTARYGDWVLLSPPAQGSTLIVWVLPVAAFAAGLAALFAYRSRTALALPSDPALLATRKEQAARDLAELDVQVQGGEIEPELADRLRPALEAEATAIEEALGASPAAGDTAPAGRSRARVVVGSAAVIAACAGIAFGVTRSTEPRPAGGTVTGNITQPGATQRDLSQVTNEEMEQVVTANPTVVPMRLALVERYLRSGDIEKAREHSRLALENDPSPADRQRALKYLGWSSSILGDAEGGVQLLEQSLAMEPDDLDAKWFLASVRLEALNDPEGAIALLESILASEGLPADKRAQVETKLAAARGAAR